MPSKNLLEEWTQKPMPYIMLPKHCSPSEAEDKALLAMSLAVPLVQPKTREESSSKALGTKSKDENALFMT